MQDINNKFFKQTEIDGAKYQITLLPALDAMRMARTLSKVVLPLFGGALDGMREDDLLSTPSTFSDLAIVLCGQLDNIDLDSTITTLLKGALCNSQPFDVNEHFRGDFGNLITLLEFALKENFSSFFVGKGLMTRLEGLMGTTQDQ